MDAPPKMGDTVTIRYECRTSDGELLEASLEEDGTTIVLGEEMLLPALEDALQKMRPGESRELVLGPGEAFGEYRKELTGEVPTSLLPDAEQLEPGMVIDIPTEGDEPSMQATVMAIMDDVVEVDGNHPLAGETLSYMLFLDSIAKTE